MSNTQTLEKMQQLTTAIEADLHHWALLQKENATPEDTLLQFANEEGIELTAEELHQFIASLQANNQELDDAHLEMIAGGRGFEFWKAEWWIETFGGTNKKDEHPLYGI